jgi:UDP-N-acetylglucosamine:LPS N-acetylglucosamine transferase
MLDSTSASRDTRTIPIMPPCMPTILLRNPILCVTSAFSASLRYIFLPPFLRRVFTSHESPLTNH